MATDKGVVAIALLLAVLLTGLLGGPALSMDSLPTADSLPSEQNIASMNEHELELDIPVLPPRQPHDPLWFETYGGASGERGFSVAEVSTGGFIIVGSTKSYGAGGRDLYIVRTNSTGGFLWNKTYGGTLFDTATDIKECSSGGFIIVGWTESYGEGGKDLWLLRTNASGDLIWDKTFGGSKEERGEEIIECSDGGFAIIGRTASVDPGNYDAWLIRLNATGGHLWNQTYGGAGIEYGYGIVECSEGGFAITGWTQSYGAGSFDMWLMRTDAAGDHRWNTTFGGSASDSGSRLVEVSTGGFIIAGQTWSYSKGYADAWLVRTNASGDYLWDQIWGGAAGNDVLRYVIEVSDGTFAATGLAATSIYSSSYDVFMVRVDTNGEELWSRTYGGGALDEGNRIIEVSEGGYIIACETMSYGNDNQMMLLRIPVDIWMGTITSEWNYTTSNNIQASPTIADIDGDGDLEILIVSHDAKLYSLSSTGNLEWSFTTGVAASTTPTVADIDDDGELEVLFSSWDSKFYCVNGNGFQEWSYTLHDMSESSPAIVDIDGDGDLEILFGGDDGALNGWFYCLNNSGHLEWEYNTECTVKSSPAVADIDNDGKIEVIFGAGDDYVYCLNETGDLEWRYLTGADVYSSPAIADIDEDGKLEILVGSEDNSLYCINGVGEKEWNYATGGAVYASPVIADIDEDGNLEVLVGSMDNWFYCVDETGNLEF